MPPELLYLTLVALLTTLIWLPYSLNLIMEHGLQAAVGNRDQTHRLAPWAERARRAHANAVENLAVFATVVLVAAAMNKFDAVTGWAAAVYFWARLVHYLVYAFGWIWVRTLAWTVGWICCLAIIWRILG
ncbi:MAG: MAPEG family protein [SAR324 cluster bacterium]